MVADVGSTASLSLGWADDDGPPGNQIYVSMEQQVMSPWEVGSS